MSAPRRSLVPAVVTLFLVGCDPPPVFEASVPAPAVEAARAHLARMWSAAALEDLAVADARVAVDAEGEVHVRLPQLHHGVPVWQGETIVHLDGTGTALVALTDDREGDLVVEPSPSVSKEEAIRAAVATVDCAEDPAPPSVPGGPAGRVPVVPGSCLTAPPEAELTVLRHMRRDHLTWKVSLRREDGTPHTSLPVVFVDAHAGDLVWRYDNLQTGRGVSLYAGEVDVATYKKPSTGTFYLQDVVRALGTYTGRGSTSSTASMTDKDDRWDSPTQRAAVDAHWGAAQVFDYYGKVHKRRGIDGKGGPGSQIAADGSTLLVVSRVHYGRAYANAFWNGWSMSYGDGDGDLFGPLVTLDICGHEMTHGVTERTAKLTYAGESGALNESMSDVMGAMIERFVRGESAETWKIGEQAFTPGKSGDALRFMDDPHKAGDPDHYSLRYRGSEDNGGVHSNSGIGNKAFHLVAKGGAHRLGGSMTGIGADAAARIWYKALTGYMTSGTTYKGARAATLAAAQSLYGKTSSEAAAVAKAWSLVGVE